MNKKIIALTLSLLLITITAAGCLGGDDDTGGQTEPTLVEQKGEMTANAWVQSDEVSQGEGVDVKAQVPINIPANNIVSIKFTIQIIDGCGEYENENTETKPDVLKGEKVVGGGGENATGGMGYEERIPGGAQTPATVNVDFRAREGDYLPNNWNVHLLVTIHASENQWPGPGFIIIWSGVPDRGFCYDITAEYTYMSEGE